MAELYTGLTVFGLYDDQTGSPLFGTIGATIPSVGSPATSSAVIVGGFGTDSLVHAISTDANGYLNVNASITPPSDNTASGTLTTSPSTVTVSTEGTSGLMVQITGTWTGTIDFKVSLDGTTYQTVAIYPAIPNGSPAVSSTAANGNWTLPVGGIRQFQVSTAGLTSGSADIILTAGQGQYSVFNYSDNAANFLATAYQGGTWTVAATQSGGWTVTADMGTGWTGVGVNLSDGSGNAIGSTAGSLDVNITNASVAVTGTVAVTQSTSPWVVSGTVTADAGTGTFKVAPDGTIWALTGTSANVDVTNTVTVSGTVTADAGTGTFTVAGTLTNNNAAPAAANVGVLPTVAQGGTLVAPAPAAYTAGNQVLPLTSLGGSLSVIPADELFAGTLSYFSYDSGASYKNITSASTPVWSIKANSASIKFLLRELQWFTDGSIAQFKLVKNGSLTGAAFAAGPGNTQVDTAATAITGGTVIMSGYVGAVPRIFDQMMDALANADTVTVVVSPLGSKTNVLAQARWSEQSAAI